MTAATTWPVLDEALDTLRTAVAGVTDWTAPSPCTEWTVRQVLEHAAGDQVAWAALVGGGPMPDYDPFAPTGEVPGSARELLEPALAASRRAWGTVAADAGSTPTPLPRGAMSPELAVGACALDAAVHAWDIARGSGQPSPLGDELAAAVAPAAYAIAEPLRDYGVFGPVVPGEPGDGAAASLLRYLGRDPQWAPPTL